MKFKTFSQLHAERAVRRARPELKKNKQVKTNKQAGTHKRHN